MLVEVSEGSISPYCHLQRLGDGQKLQGPYWIPIYTVGRAVIDSGPDSCHSGYAKICKSRVASGHWQTL